MKKNISLSFDRRYLFSAICVFIVAVYFSLNDKLLCSFSFKILAEFSIVFILISALIIFLICMFMRKNPKATGAAVTVFVYAFIIILAFLRVNYTVSSLNLKEELIKEYPIVNGYILKEPDLSSSGKSYKLTVNVSSLSNDSSHISLKDSFRLFTYVKKGSFSKDPEINDEIKLILSGASVSEPAFNGAFDYLRYLRQNNCVYGGYTENAEITAFKNQNNEKTIFSKFKNLGYKIRNTILYSVNSSSFGDDEKALLSGILTGDKSEFSDELYSNYTSSGLAHIISVSGLHTSYLFLLISLLLFFLRVPKKIIFIITIPILFIFSAAAMFTPSVMRSVIMISISLISIMLGRPADSITSLFIAAFVLIIHNPYVIENISFLFSFGSTLSILVFSFIIEQRLSFVKLSRIKSVFIKKIYSYITASVSLSLSSLIGTAYFSAKFFGKISFGAVIANIFVLPPVAVSFVGGIINTVFSLISKNISNIITVYILNPCLKFINLISSVFSTEYLSITVPRPNPYFFFVYLLLCVFLYLLLSKQK